MSQLWLAWLAITAGFGGLIWSADRFVGGSAAIANNAGISRLIIGLTIVSLGTSAPEIVVSISSALKGAGELAVGNALGSNLANIGLVLAITALIAPMPIQRHLVTQELPILLLVTSAAGLVLYDAKITNVEGALLLASVIPLFYFLIKAKQKKPAEQVQDSGITIMSTPAASFWFFTGLAALIASSELLVWGAQVIATDLGVSPLIIGLTVIAIGTSLPELAASVMSAIKGHHEMALGNIIGSNIFNILVVMALPGIIHPPLMEVQVFSRDFAAMGAITLLLASVTVIDYQLRNRHLHSSGTAKLGRAIGALLLTGYIGYYYLLFH